MEQRVSTRIIQPTHLHLYLYCCLAEGERKSDPETRLWFIITVQVPGSVQSSDAEMLRNQDTPGNCSDEEPGLSCWRLSCEMYVFEPTSRDVSQLGDV